MMKQLIRFIYNMAVADRTTLNDLLELIRAGMENEYPHLKNIKPNYHDFRAEDVRHSLADISKAESLMGYCPNHRIGAGIDQALKEMVS